MTRLGALRKAKRWVRDVFACEVEAKAGGPEAQRLFELLLRETSADLEKLL